MHLLKVVGGAKIGNMRLEVFSCVQLQTPPFEGENLGRGGHFVMKIKQYAAAGGGIA
jgi:hypothetical protein